MEENNIVADQDLSDDIRQNIPVAEAFIFTPQQTNLVASNMTASSRSLLTYHFATTAQLSVSPSNIDTEKEDTDDVTDKEIILLYIRDLIKLAKRYDITQRDISDKTGLQPSTITQSYTDEISPDSLLKLASYFINAFPQEILNTKDLTDYKAAIEAIKPLIEKLNIKLQRIHRIKADLADSKRFKKEVKRKNPELIPFVINNENDKKQVSEAIVELFALAAKVEISNASIIQEINCHKNIVARCKEGNVGPDVLAKLVNYFENQFPRKLLNPKQNRKFELFLENIQSVRVKDSTPLTKRQRTTALTVVGNEFYQNTFSTTDFPKKNMQPAKNATQTVDKADSHQSPFSRLTGSVKF